MKLYEVLVLKAHNPKRGIKKAPDEKHYVMAKNALHAKDLVERINRLPGIKYCIGVKPVPIEEYWVKYRFVG